MKLYRACTELQGARRCLETYLDLDQDITSAHLGQGHLDDAPVLGLLISVCGQSISIPSLCFGFAYSDWRANASIHGGK
jgi:hypothetical protein